MKKILFFFLLSITYISNAQVSNITDNSDLHWLLETASCDEVKTSELYSSYYAILFDEFTNNGSSKLYLQKSSFLWEVLDWTDWQKLCTFNNSIYDDWSDRFLNFNKNYLSSVWWAVNPWQTVRHLTTNQEYWSWWKFWEWSFNTWWIVNNTTPWFFNFTKANVRNPSNHPNDVKTWNSFDCQIKIWTVYDNDDNMNTTSDNNMLVECKRYQIRWCWDWIVSNNNWESCDNWVLNWTPWNNCSATCQPILCKNWWVWWTLTWTINLSTPWLCQSWVSAGNFNSTLSWNTTNYSWSCWQTSWWNCSASYTDNNTNNCKNWWVWWTLTWTINLSTPWLCQSWVSVWNFNSTLSWNTTNYSWSCGQKSWWNCSASYTDNNTNNCTNWWVWWTLTWTINLSTPWLCQSWVSVWNFNSTLSWNTTNYSWSCGQKSWWNCSANYTDNNTNNCINWWVWWTLTSAINLSTPWLCQSWVIVWNFNSTVSWNTTNYSWSCGQTSWWNCSANYTVSTPPWWGWWWGWWSSSVCNSLTASTVSGNIWTNVSFICNWSSNQYTIDIRNTTSWGNTLIHTFTNVWWNYTFNSLWTYTAQCYVWLNNATDTNTCKKTIIINNNTSNWWWWWWWWGSTYCWDWIIQRPNSAWIYEECDFLWYINTWNGFCTNQCRIDHTVIGWWNFIISPSTDMIIWNNQSILENNVLSITNKSTSDIYIENKLCAYNINSSKFISWYNYCTPSNVWLIRKNWWVFNATVPYNQFVWNTSSIPNGTTYGDAQIKVTLEWYKSIYTFLESTFNVKVSKSSISTLWWWAALLNWTNLSDLQDLSSGGFALLNPNINRNLFLSSIWYSPLSSYTKSTNDQNLIKISKNTWNKELNSFSWISNNNSNIIIYTLPTEKYNSIDNVYTHKWNVILNSEVINWSSKTYIIESWDLIINWDITSDTNILFVVKWGNIKISNNVKKIDAILMNIWWNITWDTTSTSERLLINWSLYWNISDLLNKRTYIKNRWEYIDVWTNINFTSKIFNLPPPLLTSFMSEYTESKKIPK